MKRDKENFEHLINNLVRASHKESIFNYESGRRAFLSLGKGNVHRWLETLLPNTRLILEPKIIGSSIALQYLNGKINKAINEDSRDITDIVYSLSSVPKSIPIKKRIEIRGVLYKNGTISDKKTQKTLIEIKKISTELKEYNFCAFQIFHCKINQFQALQQLKKLNFEIPETYFTNFLSDFEIYHKCWKEGKLFQNYPTNGIVLKINSTKLQKYLGENNLSINWAYSIN